MNLFKKRTKSKADFINKAITAHNAQTGQKMTASQFEKGLKRTGQKVKKCHCKTLCKGCSGHRIANINE